MTYLIVGVDIGTTSSVAVLNLSGNLLDVTSSRDVGVDNLVSYIEKHGIPAIVASDVSKPPKSIQKIASSFGARVHAPRTPLSIDDKRILTKKFNIKNAHERDALASALFAFKKVKNILRKADKLGLNDSRKYEILQGEPIAERPQKKVKQPKITLEKMQVTPPPLRKKIRNLERQRKNLIAELSEKNEEIKRLRDKSLAVSGGLESGVSQDLEVKRLKKNLKARGDRIRILEDELSRIYQFRFLWNKIVEGKARSVGIFPNSSSGLTFMPNKISRADEKNLKNLCLVFTDNKSNIKELSKKDIPYACEDFLRRFYGCLYVESEILEQLLKPSAESVEKIIEEYKNLRSGKVN